MTTPAPFQMSGFIAPAAETGHNSYPPPLEALVPLRSAALADVADVAAAEQDTGATDSDGPGVAELMARRRERRSLPRDERDRDRRRAAEKAFADAQTETASAAYETFQSAGGDWQAQMAASADRPELSVAELREQRQDRHQRGIRTSTVRSESTPAPQSWSGFNA